MGPKGARRAQAGQPGALGPAGLAHFGAQSVSVFFSTKYASTLIYVLPKPPTISAYKYPEAAIKEEDPEKSIQRYIQVRHKRKATPEAPHRPSAPLQVGGQQGIHPLPEISSP